MRTIETTAVVNPDHTITIIGRVPDDIAPGAVRVKLEIETGPPAPTEYPFGIVPYPIGLTDPNFTFRREDLYGDGDR